MNKGSPDNYTGYGTCLDGQFLPGTDIPDCNSGNQCNGWYNGGFNVTQILNVSYGDGTGMIDGCDKYCYDNDPATSDSWQNAKPDAGDGPSSAPPSTNSLGLGGFKRIALIMERSLQLGRPDESLGVLSLTQGNSKVAC
jgi:hypothetical protein